MKKNLLFTVLLFALFSTGVDAQRWLRQRWELAFGVGTTNFMGDLGGGTGDASHFFGLSDFNFTTTQPSFQVGLRFRMRERLSNKFTFTYAYLSAEDAASQAVGRRLRNLSFRSIVLDFGTQFEFYFLKEKSRPRYAFSSLRGLDLSAYIFVGVGGFYYNPQADLNGTTYNLQEMHTEGQGMDGGPPNYSLFALSFPIGMGMKYRIDRTWTIGAEISNRYTTTDYLDDASDKYYDNAAIKDQYGAAAAELADRHLVDGGGQGVPYASGKTHRGIPNYDDAYIMFTLQLIYRLKTTRKGLPKF